MVKSGEEAGKLDEVLLYLADYLDRTYEVTSKAKNALIYPIFVIVVFCAVMTLMLTMVIPNISKILVESGQEIPFYTKVVLGISNLLVHYGVWVLIGGIIVGFFGFRYGQTQQGRMFYSRVKISIPFIGTLNKKLFLARIADNLNTMLLSAIPIVKALDITASVVENAVYEQILKETVDAVRTGSSLSVAMARHKEIPGIMVQMMRVGEETGELGDILKTLANFYNREVKNAVDTLIGLIEPAMIVFLGVGVAVLLASVLIPIYNISGGV
jgi:type IV pilus assembly protein PilC